MNKSQNYIYFNPGKEYLLLNTSKKDYDFLFNSEKEEDNSFNLNSFNSLSHLDLSNYFPYMIKTIKLITI